MMESGALRVLHLSAGNLYGGIETMLRTLAVERLACPAMQPEFALVTEGRLSTELRAAGVPVHMLGAVRVRYPWTVLRARHTLRTLLKKQRYDVAVCHGAWPHGLAAPALRAAAVPFAFFQHGIAEGTHWTERWAKRVAPDVVLANSQFCAGSAKKLFAAAAPVVVYCPIPSPKPMTDEKRAEIRGAVRRELGTADGDVVVLQVSRMEPWKGHRLLLQALARVPAGTPWTLWVAGGAQRKEEEAYVADLHAMSASLGVAPRNAPTFPTS